MRLARISLLLVCLEVIGVVRAFSQAEREPSIEEWRTRIDAAKKRVDKLRREGNLIAEKMGDESQINFDEELSVKRGMEDEDLRPGDIVATRKGLLRFKGYSSRSNRIFVPADAK
jgi:hypothetical protein